MSNAGSSNLKLCDYLAQLGLDNQIVTSFCKISKKRQNADNQ
jgi:hypothetical protein